MLLALTLVVCAQTSAPLRVLVRAEVDDFLPPQANPVHAELEALEEFAQLEKRPLQVVPVSAFSELIPSLLAGKGDVIAAGLTITSARKKLVAFTRPTRSVDEVLVGRAGDAALPRTVEQLKGRTVVVPRGSSFVESLAELDGVVVQERDGLQAPDQLAREVADGAIPLTVIDTLRLDVIRQYQRGLEPLFPIAKGRAIAFAVRPADEKLRSRLDSFLIARAFTDDDGEAQTGDLPLIEKRKTLRVLTRNNAVSFYLYKGNREGFDYELIKAFAKSRKLRLEVVLAPSYADLIPMLKAGQGDVIAASLTATDERAREVSFTRPYLLVKELFVQRAGAPPLTSLEQLRGRTVTVRKSSSYAEKLRPLVAQYGFKLNDAPEDLEVEDLLADVDEGVVELTVADSHFFEAEKLFRKNLEAPLALSGEAPIAFATRQDNPKLLAALEAWVKKTYRSTEYNLLKRRHFESRGALTEARELSTAVTGSISPFDGVIKKYSQQYGFDWRLMSAQAWRESRFDAKAKSGAGAVGLFQVLPSTGKELGFTRLADPEQGTHAGIKYMNQLVQRLEPALPLDERVRFSLAAYNAGFARLQDARRLAKELRLDPDVWTGNVEKAMGLMARPQYARRVRTGFCRCQEPVDYVTHIENKYSSFVQLVKD